MSSEGGREGYISVLKRQSIGVFTRCGFVFGAFAVVVQECEVTTCR